MGVITRDAVVAPGPGRRKCGVDDRSSLGRVVGAGAGVGAGVGAGAGAGAGVRLKVTADANVEVMLLSGGLNLGGVILINGSCSVCNGAGRGFRRDLSVS